MFHQWICIRMSNVLFITTLTNIYIRFTVQPLCVRLIVKYIFLSMTYEYEMFPMIRKILRDPEFEHVQARRKSQFLMN